MPTWDADQYLRFDDERSRPCRELAARVALDEPRLVIDLGCGPGNSTAILAARWPNAELTGVDTSLEMIGAAQRSQTRASWQLADIAAWSAETGPAYDVVFSNAALQWVGDHGVVFPRLMRRVAAGGALAVQLPANYDAPAHQVMRELAQSAGWRERFAGREIRDWHVHDLRTYYDLLAPLAAAIDLWQTEYMHVLADVAAIVEWYRGTGLRPYLDALASDELRELFLAEYLERIRPHFPLRSDGRVLFPFRRLFVIASQRA